MTLTRLHPGRRTRRVVALLAIALLCLTIVMIFAGAALAAEKVEIPTSEGLEAPSLDYTFVWWSFIITFGLLAAYYFLILKLSYSEFKKIVDAHFGPKQDKG